MVGNDFTRPFLKPKFDDSRCFRDEVKSFLLSQHRDFRICSENVDLDKAMRYSRAMYNNHDLASFDGLNESGHNRGPASSFEVEDEEYMSGPNSESYSLNASQKKCFRTWLEVNFDPLKPANYGEMVACFLYNNLKERRSESTNLFREVNCNHLYALRIMQDAIKRQIEALPDSDANASSRVAMALSRVKSEGSMQWYDVLASRTYQLLLKCLAVECWISINVSMSRCMMHTNIALLHLSPSFGQSLSLIPW